MTTATRTCNFILSASEQVPAGRAALEHVCQKSAVAAIGSTLFRCENHYVELLAERPKIDLISCQIGVAIWQNMDVKVFG